jgi:NAD(P)-dependent dehydrogenase (short-subunit alcohol dehydrogenase family)
MSGFWLISGASRGLGAALARAAFARGDRVLGLARGVSAAGETMRWDLSRLDGLAEALVPRLQAACASAPPPAQWVLVNNAGLLGPIGAGYAAADIQQLLQVNLAAPMLLARCFIDTLAAVDARKLVINISSGAATRVIRGWSLYSASKAGLEHFGRCLAAEQAAAEHPVDVLNLSPGVIDTDMQSQIRAAGPAGFPDHAQFVDLHARHALASADAVADAILRGVAKARTQAGRTRSLAEFAGD